MKMPKAKQTTLDPVVPLPDMNDAAIRKSKADALAGLLKHRGRSSTIFKHTGGSGQLSDQFSAPRAKAMVSRGG